MEPTNQHEIQFNAIEFHWLIGLGGMELERNEWEWMKQKRAAPSFAAGEITGCWL